MSYDLERLTRLIEADASPAGQSEMYQLDDVYQCLRFNRRWAPKALAFVVPGEFVDTDQEEYATILVVPTAIRVVHYYPEDEPNAAPREVFELPEYEVEGWLLGDYPRKYWVLLELRTERASIYGQPDSVSEASITRFEPGEEQGNHLHPLLKARRTNSSVLIAKEQQLSGSASESDDQ